MQNTLVLIRASERLFGGWLEPYGETSNPVLSYNVSYNVSPSGTPTAMT